MALLVAMVKPKKAVKKQEVVGEMDLDNIVASPAQMAGLEKENEDLEASKRAKYRAAAMKAITPFKKK